MTVTNQRIVKLFLCVVAAAALTACQSVPPKTEAVQAPLSQQQPQSQTQPVPRVEQSTLVQQVQTYRRSLEEDVRQLLSAAEDALAADRLTTPVEDNAFDRFQAVLLLQPSNEQARSGLQSIFSRYISMAKDEIARNRFGQAKALIERARFVDERHPLLTETQQALRDKQRSYAAVVKQPPPPVDENEVLLDPSQLSQQNDVMVSQLQALANQVKETDESILIVARNDAEGRWIYRQMAEAVLGYRLRGDIRLGKVPKIMLLPPID